jgi:hypothetical protein
MSKRQSYTIEGEVEGSAHRLHVRQDADPAHVEKIAVWRSNLSSINSDVGNLLLNRYIFRETQETIQ